MAVRFDPSSGLLSVFLHSEAIGYSNTSGTIDNLLQLSELEVAKRLSQDGIPVPFDKEHGESCKIVGSRKTATSITSEASGSSCADTPASSVAGGYTVEEDGLGYKNGEPQPAKLSEGVGNEQIGEMCQNFSQPDLGPQVTQVVGIEETVDNQDIVKPLAEPILEPSEPLAQSTQFNEWDFGTHKKANNGTTAVDSNLMNELVADVRLERQEHSAEIIDHDAWAKWKSTWTMATEEFHSSYLSEEGKKKKTKKVTISPAPELEDTPQYLQISEDFGHASYSTNRGVLSEPVASAEANLAQHEDTTDFVDDDFCRTPPKKSKKDKKKGGKKRYDKIGESTIDFPIKAIDPVVDLDWMNFNQKHEAQKARDAETMDDPTGIDIIKGVTDKLAEPPASACISELTDDVPVVPEPDPDPELKLKPVCHDFDWDFSFKNSKIKKGKWIETEYPIADEIPIVETDIEVAMEDVWASIKKNNKKKAKQLAFKDPILEPDTVAEPEPDIPVHDWLPKKEKKKPSKQLAFEDTVIEQVILPSSKQPDTIIDEGWGSLSTKKDKKMKHWKLVSEDPVLKVEKVQEPEPKVVEGDPLTEPVEAPTLEVEEAPEDDCWSGWGRKRRLTRVGQDVVECLDSGLELEIPMTQPDIPEPEPEPEACTDQDVWTLPRSKKDKKKKGKKVVLQESSPEHEPEPEPIPEELSWGSISGKKQKSKKAVIETPLPEPGLEQQLDAAIEYGWGSFSSKRSKKKQKAVIETTLPEPQPEAVVDDDGGWGSFGISEKYKKVKKIYIEQPPVEPATGPDTIEMIHSRRAIKELPHDPQPEAEMRSVNAITDAVHDLGWGSFVPDVKNGGKKKKKAKIESSVPEPESENAPAPEDSTLR